MDKRNNYDDFRVGNYVRKFGGSIYVIEKIIDSGSTLEIKKFNSLVRKQETETVEKHHVYGIELLPDDMKSFGLKEGGIFNLRHHGRNTEFRFKIYESLFMWWTNLPDLEKPKPSHYRPKAFLITEDIPVDWDMIDEYVQEGSLIPMNDLHTLQNYIEDNNLSFLSLDYSDIISNKLKIPARAVS